jgi:hypothetical protein
MSKQEATAVDEGARSATRFIEQVADGQCNADLSHALHKLGLRLAAECRQRQDKCSGEVTLRLKFVAEPSGIVGVGYEVNAKEPKTRTSGSVFWITKGGNFTGENPRQTVIPGIREVKVVTETRELEAANDNGEPRSV